MRGNLRNVQCYHCKKFGHIQSNCWYKDKNIGEGSSSNIDKNASEEFGRLFIVHTETGSPEPSF